MLAKLWRHYDEIRLEAACLAGRRYPAFVNAAKPSLADDDVPVFVFHSIAPDEFEAQLSYLTENGYRTLTCDEFVRHIRGEKRAPPRSVLLTIDDGRASVWMCGLPLLERYGAKAVVFVIPGYVRDAEDLPERHDPGAGHVPGQGLPRRDPELMSWGEIERMAKSGLVDIQCHTLYHHPVPISAKIVDYLNPAHAAAIFDVPIEPGREEQLREHGIAALYGAPIYESAPLMSGQPCYRPEPDLADLCMEHVAGAGGADFFRKSGWRRELDGIVNAHLGRHGDRGRMLDGAEQRQELARDLRASRELIEARLDNRVRHLCYPYTIGSELAVEVSRQVGYVTNFWGVLAGRRSNRPGDDPHYCPRLKGDYLFRLPGQGRRSLSGVMVHKVARRISGGPVY